MTWNVAADAAVHAIIDPPVWLIFACVALLSTTKNMLLNPAFAEDPAAPSVIVNVPTLTRHAPKTSS